MNINLFLFFLNSTINPYNGNENSMESLAQNKYGF